MSYCFTFVYIRHQRLALCSDIWPYHKRVYHASSSSSAVFVFESCPEVDLSRLLLELTFSLVSICCSSRHPPLCHMLTCVRPLSCTPAYEAMGNFMLLMAAIQSTLRHSAAMAHLRHTHDLDTGGIDGEKIRWKPNMLQRRVQQCATKRPLHRWPSGIPRA